MKRRSAFKEHEVVVLAGEYGNTPESGTKGCIVHVYPDKTTYEVEFPTKKITVTLKEYQLRKQAKVNFYSPMRDASGLLLETEIYFNNSVDEVIEQLQEYKEKYSEYDWLALENDPNGYCLVGYVRGRREEV